jgi:protein O-GlcNAc transferase
MAPAEIAFLRGILLGKKRYAEFGAGGSTCLAVQCGLNQMRSVESDQGWIEQTRNESGPQVEFIHIDINADPRKWGAPADDSKRDNWPAYSGGLDDLTWTPQVILVDGRFRVACSLKALRVMDDDTILLVHDYTKRFFYHIIEPWFRRIAEVGSMVAFRKAHHQSASELDALITSFEYTTT